MGAPPTKTTTDPRHPGRKVPEYLSTQRDELTDECVEVASEDSFPASDPPSYTPVTHAGQPVKRRKK